MGDVFLSFSVLRFLEIKKTMTDISDITNDAVLLQDAPKVDLQPKIDLQQD